MKNIQECPICKSSALQPYLKTKDYFGNEEAFELIKCTSCHGLTTTPQPSQDEIIPYYKSNSYISHGNESNNLISTLYRIIQRKNFNYKKKIIQKYVLNQNILDYGCGTGHFLKYLSDHGWSTEGIEPDQEAKEVSIQKGLNIVDLNAISSTFDCISLFHVLEHVHELQSTIHQLKKHLSTNGIMIVALPNYESYDAQHYQEFWAGYDVPRHLYHFNQKTMFQLFKKFGLNIVATHPLYFDSYYVSLLSEEYKHGKKKFISGIWNGFISNQKAKSTKEYSSLIYVLSR